MAPRNDLEHYEATEAQDLTRLLRALRPPTRELQVPPLVDLTIRAEIWKAPVRRQLSTLLSMARQELIRVIRQALLDNPLLEEVARAEEEDPPAGGEHAPDLTAAAADLTDAEERYDSIWQACVADGWDAHGLPSQADDAPGTSAPRSNPPDAIVADMIVMKVGHDYQVVLNDNGMPRLRISATYRRLLRDGEPAAKHYVADKLRAAVDLIRGIEQRRQTLYKVAASIVKFQRDFFALGLPHLKPLVLKDVAEDIGMHESTVSCVTANKYMDTERGLFELKYFFHSGLEFYAGETMSSLTVKERMKKLVAAEDQANPLTDQQLVERLAAESIKIARRTVTKYRRELKLPPANRRKRGREVVVEIGMVEEKDTALSMGPLAISDEEQRVRQALEAHTRRWLTEPPPLGDREGAFGVPPEVEEAQRHRYPAWLELTHKSPKMQEVSRLLERALHNTATVLLTGERGTGKNHIARLLHDQGPRAKGPFIAVNCTAVPETLLEAELFGEERGAFTGAPQHKLGCFDLAAAGTLFLNEIGDMSPVLQAKLLRVLQERQFERLGGTETITTEARIVAATNRDLEGLITEGRFRRDLFYRLNVHPIALPPLRERKEDLGPLTMFFLTRFSQKLRKEVVGISKEALGLLERYPWPGNVRELEAVIGQAVARCQGPMVTAQDLPQALREPSRAPVSSGEAIKLPPSGIALADLEKQLLQQALEQAHQNTSHAAKLLGLSRAQLRARMRHYRLETD
jgi:DNA-binding NtrC family response regulator/DNA-directed RNA polymerase specialized sigma54-like protein